MSVQEPEPRIPNDDNGRGLRGIGWFLLLWVAIGLVWIPPNQWRDAGFMARVLLGCGIAGILFLIAGFIVGRRTPPAEVLQQQAHDRIAASDDGADQHDSVA
jgi:hypothetical protein